MTPARKTTHRHEVHLVRNEKGTWVAELQLTIEVLARSVKPLPTRFAHLAIGRGPSQASVTAAAKRWALANLPGSVGVFNVFP